jgi:ribosomal protein S27AE
MSARYKFGWRGKIKPKRPRCPKCGKLGLGQINADKKLVALMGVPVRTCRYCFHVHVVKSD